MADQVLCSGVACITDLMVKERLVDLDFADVCSIMSEMGTAMIGTGEAMGERRAQRAAKAAIANPLLAIPITPPKRFAVERSHAIASSPADRLSKGGGSLILAAGLSTRPASKSPQRPQSDRTSLSPGRWRWLPLAK